MTVPGHVSEGTEGKLAHCATVITVKLCHLFDFSSRLSKKPEETVTRGGREWINRSASIVPYGSSSDVFIPPDLLLRCWIM